MAKTILCVDDSVTMQTVAEITFKATEYTYVGARDVDEGFAVAKRSKPSLVLADAVMPGKTGYDLCQALKSDPELRDVPVLMMCGNSQAYDPARGADVGADGHVTKPWDTQVMLDKVDELLSRAASAPAISPVAAPRPPAAQAPLPPAAQIPAPPAAQAPVPLPAETSRPRPAVRPDSSIPNVPVVAHPEPPRSATIMGMPSLNLPPLKPRNPSAVAPPPSPPGVAPVPRAEAPAARASSSPSLGPAGAPQVPSMPRPPMISGTPTRRPNLSALRGGVAAVPSAPAPRAPSPRPPSPRPPSPRMQSPRLPEPLPAPPQPFAPPAPPPIAAVPAPPRAPERMPNPAAAAFERAAASAGAAAESAAAQAASEAGMDPGSPEYAALVKLSREVIERIAWEVVPELAETIIRENLDKLAAKAR